MTSILVVTSLYPPHHYGGYETTCRDVVARWRQAGHEVNILASTVTVPGRETVAAEPGVTRALHMYWDDHVILHPPRLTRLRWERENRRALLDVLDRHRPDVVSVWQLGALSMALVSTIRERHIPIVFNVHDDWLVYAPLMDAWTRMFENRPQLGRVTHALSGVPTAPVPLASAGAFCFVSEATRRHAENNGYTFPLSTVVWNGIDPTVFRRAEPKPSWEWRLLYVGRLDERKGVDTVVRALPSLPQEATLVVAGRGDQEYAAELRALVDELGLRDRVTFTAFEPNALVGAYADADAVVFPSRWEEPFGLVPLEAMAVGRPVIATGTGGSAEFCFDERNCLLYPVDDVAALSAQLIRLARDDSLRRRLVDGGLATTRELTIDRLAEVLETWHVAAATGYPAGPPPHRPRPLAELAGREQLRG